MSEKTIQRQLIEKNIQKLEYYISEEQKSFNRITSLFKNTSINYKSSNNNIIKNQMDTFKNSIPLITEKRKKYINILKQIVVRYETTSKEVAKMMKGDQE